MKSLDQLKSEWAASCAAYDRNQPLAVAKYKAMFAGSPKTVKGFSEAKAIAEKADAECRMLRAVAFKSFGVWLEWPK